MFQISELSKLLSVANIGGRNTLYIHDYRTRFTSGTCRHACWPLLSSDFVDHNVGMVKENAKDDIHLHNNIINNNVQDNTTFSEQLPIKFVCLETHSKTGAVTI